jgi:hypothetical protein
MPKPKSSWDDVFGTHSPSSMGFEDEHCIQDWSGWKMIVIDTKGKTVLEVGFDLNPRPLN